MDLQAPKTEDKPQGIIGNFNDSKQEISIIDDAANGETSKNQISFEEMNLNIMGGSASKINDND